MHLEVIIAALFFRHESYVVFRESSRSIHRYTGVDILEMNLMIFITKGVFSV